VGGGDRDVGDTVRAAGFQSQYTDPASGQVDMGARWYAPARAGFSNADTVSVDPVPDAAAGNPFGYAGDNPLDGTDPTGIR